MKHIGFIGLLGALALGAFASSAAAQVVEGAAYTPGSAATRSALSGCINRATAPTATDGQQMGVSCDASGNMLVANGPSAAPSAAIAPNFSTVAEGCRVLKAAPGNLYSVTGYVGAAAWLMVFNSTTAPADGAVTPAVWAYASTAGSWSISYGDLPSYMSVGITVCASSTGPLTKTVYATNTVFSGRVQ